jgi:CRISPR-associated protein Csd1
MILQALCEYYDRKLALGEMPPYGREMKSIPYLVVIDKDGNFLRLESTMEGDGEKQHARKFPVRLAHDRYGNLSPNSLWDNYGYVFGFPKKMDFENSENIERGRQQCDAFQKELRRLANLNPQDKGLSAVLLFYKDLQENLGKLMADSLFDEAFNKSMQDIVFCRVRVYPENALAHYS